MIISSTTLWAAVPFIAAWFVVDDSSPMKLTEAGQFIHRCEAEGDSLRCPPGISLPLRREDRGPRWWREPSSGFPARQPIRQDADWASRASPTAGAGCL